MLDIYSKCLELIPSESYNEEEIEQCVGVDFNLFLNDMNYFKKSILAIFEKSIRDVMLSKCYQDAGVSL